MMNRETNASVKKPIASKPTNSTTDGSTKGTRSTQRVRMAALSHRVLIYTTCYNVLDGWVRVRADCNPVPLFFPHTHTLFFFLLFFFFFFFLFDSFAMELATNARTGSH